MSGAFDANGRTLAFVDGVSGQPTMVARIPIGSVATICARVGDLFAWLCVGALGAFIVMALLARA